MNPFLRNLAEARRTPVRAEQPEPKHGDGGKVTLRLYDPLDDWGGSWGISAKEFVATLDGLPDDTSEIRLLINSPGGVVWEGLAILNALRAHPARVVAVVEGIAASAASFVAAGADELLMMPNSELFVHRAWGFAMGNAEDFTKFAGELEHEDRNIAAIYAAKAGGDVNDWLAAMSAETWYSADGAVAAKLADRVLTASSDDGSTTEAKNRWAPAVREQFGHEPDPKPPAPPGPSPEGRTPVATITDEQLTRLRNMAGVADDADLDTALDGVEEALEEQAETQPGGAPTPATLPEGTVAVDAETLAQLRADATAGREARTQQETDRRNTLVDEAIRDGRIAPARRNAWVAQLAADPGAEQVLASLEKGLVPLEPVGYTGGTAGSDPTDDDKLLAQLGFETQKVGG